MGWLALVLGFAVPLVFVGETLLLRIREGKPVWYLPTIATTVVAMIVLGVGLSRLHYAYAVPRLPFDLPGDFCGGELALMMLPGLVLVIAAGRHGRGVWFAVVLAIAVSCADALVADSPLEPSHAVWIFAGACAAVLVVWIATERDPALPEARVGEPTRGARPFRFVGIVAFATIAWFALLRVAPAMLVRASGRLIPELTVDDELFTADGNTIAYVANRELVLRRGEATSRVPLEPSRCVYDRFISFPTLYIFPDHAHVMLLASGSAACFISFDGEPRVVSLRRLLGGFLAEHDKRDHSDRGDVRNPGVRVRPQRARRARSRSLADRGARR